MSDTTKTTTLNQSKMPMVGFGTYLIAEDEVAACVETALRVG